MLDDKDWLLDAQDLEYGSYVLPESEFLPLPRQSDAWQIASSLNVADMLACSYPSPQHDPGESSNFVVIVVLELVLECPFLRTLPVKGQEGWRAMASCVPG